MRLLPGAIDALRRLGGKAGMGRAVEGLLGLGKTPAKKL